jgi:hypothetical protein
MLLLDAVSRLALGGFALDVAALFPAIPAEDFIEVNKKNIS